MSEPQVTARASAGVTWRRPAPPGAVGRVGSRWPRPAQLRALVRRHWLISILMAAGIVLRALTVAAYHPALIYIDTIKYLYGEYPGADPLGYRVALRAILLVGDLGTVAVIQHLLGLAIAAILYLVLVRKGIPLWLAAIAAAPILLDAYQLQMEATIMPDVWFEAMLAAGLAVLLWRPGVTLPRAVTAGLILGASATVRQIGEAVIVPVLLYLLFNALLRGDRDATRRDRGQQGADGPDGGTRRAARSARSRNWRRQLGRAAALTVAFALPIVLYSGVSYVRDGHFWLAAGQKTTGRTAAAADCATLNVSAQVRALCPSPTAQKEGPDYLEHNKLSPLFATPVVPGTRQKLLTELNTAVIHQQPERVALAVLRDSVRLFAVVRKPSPAVTPLFRWQFQTHYPNYFPSVHTAANGNIIIGLQAKVFGPFKFSVLKPAYGGKAQVNHLLAGGLRFYQLYGGYTPGPLLALFTLLGLAGSLLVLKRRASARTRQLALGCLLFTATSVVVLLGADVYEFSWRYQLPGLVTLPVAGVLGLCALLSLRTDVRSARTEPGHAASVGQPGQPGLGEDLGSGSRPGPDAGDEPGDQGGAQRPALA